LDEVWKYKNLLSIVTNGKEEGGIVRGRGRSLKCLFGTITVCIQKKEAIQLYDANHAVHFPLKKEAGGEVR